MNDLSPWRFCTAPCMDWTDTHCRTFWRGLSKQARLYTEMVNVHALLHGDVKKHLQFNPNEHPIALQLGGAKPAQLAECAALAEGWGYDEVNLNCGCPSDRVLEGRFGACLMLEPKLVAQMVREMRAATRLPVTVKHRVGIDDSEEYPFLKAFVETVAEAGCEVFIVHARKAWLQGLSPKENREVPPLTYEHVYRLKQDFPQLTVVINGGIKTMQHCQQHLQQVDGVMLGREIYENPWRLSEVDLALFDQPAPVETREQALRAVQSHAEAHVGQGGRLHHVTRHVLGLYKGEVGGRAFRRMLSEGQHDDDWALVEEALDAVLAA